MKKLMIAAAMAVMTMSHAYAQDNTPGALTFGGQFLCRDVTNTAAWPDSVVWLAGFWSGENANGSQRDAWTGENAGFKELIRETWAECINDPHQNVQNAAERVYAHHMASGS
jgi:hypothetical protein